MQVLLGVQVVVGAAAVLVVVDFTTKQIAALYLAIEFLLKREAREAQAHRGGQLFAVHQAHLPPHGKRLDIPELLVVLDQLVIRGQRAVLGQHQQV
jgi:hypothetical protein